MFELELNLQDVGHAMSAFMLEYWDKAHWNVTLSHDPRIQAGLEHGSREGSGKNAVKRVSIYTFQCTVTLTISLQMSFRSRCSSSPMYDEIALLNR